MSTDHNTPKLHAVPEPDDFPTMDEVAADEARERHEVAVIKKRMRRESAARGELAAEGWDPPPVFGSVRKQMASPLAETEWAVQGLIPAEGNIVLASQFKCGKTTLGLNLAQSLVDGVPFLGAYATHLAPGRSVAYLNLEVSGQQAQHWLRDIGVKNDHRLHVQHWRGHSTPLTVPHVADWLVDYLAGHHVSVLVIDPFAKAYGGDENSNTEVTAWLNALDAVKERAGVDVIVLIAHTGQSAGEDGGNVRARGATRLQDWPDATWTYRHGGQHGQTAPDERRYLAAFGRDVNLSEVTLGFDSATRRLSVVGGGGRAADLLASAVEAVCREVEKQPGISTTALESALPGKTDLKRRAIDTAVSWGRVRREAGPNRTMHHYPVEKFKVSPPQSALSPPPESGRTAPVGPPPPVRAGGPPGEPARTRRSPSRKRGGADRSET